MVFSQILHTASALNKICEVSSFRTRGGLKVDFLVKIENQMFAIEVKHSENLAESDFRGLLEIKKYVPKIKSFLFHFGKKEFKVKNIWALPVAVGLKEIGL